MDARRPRQADNAPTVSTMSLPSPITTKTPSAPISMPASTISESSRRIPRLIDHAHRGEGVEAGEGRGEERGQGKTKDDETVDHSAEAVRQQRAETRAGAARANGSASPAVL